MEELKVGSRLKVFADDGVYEGNVYSVDLKGTGLDDRITLHKATCLNSKKPLPALIHFYTSDFKKFEIIREPKEKPASDVNVPKLVGVCSKVTPAHLQKLKNIDQEKLAFSWQLGTKESENKNESESFNEESKEAETEYTVVDKFDETFHNSMTLLKKHTTVGLAVQGICISRRGQLCWLQIGLKKHSLLYDMLALGHEAFDHGLREILECPKIQKVVYNCRSMSDMFWHQYSVLLTNVFDIQVAEVTVFSEGSGGRLPWYVNSLPISLMENLNLKENQVFFQRARMYNKKRDESVWAHRPATDEMLDAACKNVKYLCALRCVMLEKLLRNFILGTDFYLSAYCSLSNKDFDGMRRSDDLPKEFYRLETRTPRVSMMKSQFVDNCSSCLDPVLRVSHDGISHGRHKTSAKENNDWKRLKHMKANVQRNKSAETN